MNETKAGALLVPIEVSAEVIAALVRAGLLADDRQDDKEAVAAAVMHAATAVMRAACAPVSLEQLVAQSFRSPPENEREH